MLNYHHLRYFREVARLGHLGQAAERLNVAQSALSVQIKQLEARLGCDLFDRVGRRLVLTEAGKIALHHADQVFSAGDALVATLAARGNPETPLRVGAVSTLSRNFQMRFLRPLWADPVVSVDLRSGSLRSLLADLTDLALDVVLTTELPPAAPETPFAALRIADQPVGLYGHAHRLQHPDLATLLAEEPVIVPTEPAILAGFTQLAAGLGVAPRLVARVDDMAMVRLLARDDIGVCLAPDVVLADEVASGLLVRAPYDLALSEPFFAVTLPRAYPHPALEGVLEAQV